MVEDNEADISSVLLHPDTERPIAALAKAAKSRWHIIDESFREDFVALERFAGRGEIWFSGISSGGKRFAVFINRDDASPNLPSMTASARKAARCSARGRSSMASALRPMLPVVHAGARRARDPRLSHVAERRVPQWTAHAGHSWRSLVARQLGVQRAYHQWLANRGYAVLSINFRGSTGFGKAFVNAADGEWGGRMHDDLIDGLEWALGKGYADRARVGFMGASYGGYAALIAATKTPDVFACIVDVFGVSNLLSFMQTIPPYWEPWLPILKRRLADPATEEGRAWLKDRSPLTHVDRIVRPLLIAHGMKDVRVVAAELEQIVRAVERRGIPVTYVTFPDEGHGWTRPANRLAFYAIVEQFLAKHLGGRAEPIGDALSGSSLKIEAGRQLIPGLG